jgi:methyl-accepting chemotaxis protein
MAFALSFRRKMLLPAAVAVAGTLVATGVMLVLSRQASALLDHVENQDFPTVQGVQALNSATEALARGLEEAAAAEDSLALEDLDDAYAALLARATGPQHAELRTALEAWYPLARRTTADWIHRRLGDGELEALRAMQAKLAAVRDRLEPETAWARAEVAAGFDDARRRQHQSVLVGVGILLAAALGAAVLAWVIAVRTERPLVALKEAALRVAAGDLSPEIAVETDDEVGALAESFRQMVRRLREIVGTLKASARDLAGAAEKLSELTRAQSGALEAQASGVTETTTTARELEQTSQMAASRAAAVLEVARRAAELGEAGQAAAHRSAEGIQRIQGSVEDIVTQSSRLLERTRQVGDIVETVRDLATQSHVLSLNASIEAARAGEAGRGFAVVAAEVRALAEQSGQSAGRIARMVQEILDAIQATLEATERSRGGMDGSLAQIRASGDSLKEVGGFVRETGDAALQIASAVQQQSTGVAQIATAMRDLDKGMEGAVARIQTLEGSALQVAETATRISAIVNAFD